MITVDEALSRVLSLAGTPRPETLSLDHAAGRVLLEPAVARMTQPPFNSAAMDGYALRRTDADKALTIIGEAAAGHPWNGQVQPESAIRIFTGAPVPDGYDCVAMQEHVTRDGDQIRIHTPSDKDNIRPRGSDFAEGDVVKPGRKLGAADIGLLAAMNVPRVTVAARPRVAVMAGGDELVHPGTDPTEGEIICSNDLAVAALAQEVGAEVAILPIARDTEASLRDNFARASNADLIVTIGGASVGDHDLIGKVTGDLGMERAFYKLAMRPGRPLMAGNLAGQAMLGLPGNPVSAVVCGVLFMQPLIRRMQGLAARPVTRRARLALPMPAEGDRQHYHRAILSEGPDLPLINPFANQDSARLGILAQADALLIRPAADPARDAGEVVEYIPLNGEI